jgi:hypothetical protein
MMLDDVGCFIVFFLKKILRIGFQFFRMALDPVDPVDPSEELRGPPPRMGAHRHARQCFRPLRRDLKYVMDQKINRADEHWELFTVLYIYLGKKHIYILLYIYYI